MRGNDPGRKGSKGSGKKGGGRERKGSLLQYHAVSGGRGRGPGGGEGWREGD